MVELQTVKKKRNLLCGLILFFAFAVVFFFANLAFADNPANPNYVIEEIQSIMDGYTPKLLKYARTLFISLATISLAVGMGTMILSGESTLGSVAAHLTRWIIYCGFFMYVMGGQTFFIPHLVVDSFTEAASTIAGSEVMPGDVLEEGIVIFGTLMAKAIELGWKEVIVAGLSGILLIVIFALLAAILAVTLIEMYVVVCGGSILLGFAGVDYTKDIAISYLKYSVSVGVKLLVVMIIATVARDMSGNWANNLNMINEGEFFTLVGYLLGGSICLTMAAQMVPNIAQGMITGASLSTGGAFRGAAAALTGAAIVAGGGARSIATGMSNTGQAMRNYRSLNPGAGTLGGLASSTLRAASEARASGSNIAETFGAAARYAASQGVKPFETLGAGARYARDSAIFGTQSWQAAQHLGRKEGNYVDPPT